MPAAPRAEPLSPTLVVHEIYASIQGEGSLAGWPCTLIRLTGCNLRCRWCDTTHAFRGGRRMRLSEVLLEVERLDTPLVLVTGGEPLLQAATLPLLRALCDTGRIVQLETSGERDIALVDPRVRRVVDLKPPASGESHRIRWSNLRWLTRRDEVKFVLADRADYEWARAVVRRHRLDERVGTVLMGPVWGELDPRELVAWVLQDRLRVRVQVQLHKILWGADAKGV